MDKLLELSDIRLIPTEKNSGGGNSIDVSVVDQLDGTRSFPIFTSPMDTVVNETNWSEWDNRGIRPVLPRTVDLSLRIEGCQYVFAAFSLQEIRDNFCNGKRNSKNIFRICIDSGNGHDIDVINAGKMLKTIYQGQVNLMAGNIANPKTYIEYCKVGFDYVRVGISNGSLVDDSRFGFHYPLVSLLIDITGTKNISCGGLKHAKIIADGSISSHADIMKAMAVGADYVMIGREFSKLVEAAGPILMKNDDGKYKEVNKDDVLKLNPQELKASNFSRLYKACTTEETRKNWRTVDAKDWAGLINRKIITSDAKNEYVKVNKTLDYWIQELVDCIGYGFTMADAQDWVKFKNNIKFIRVE